MKKYYISILLIIVFIAISTLASCGSKYNGWQTIDLGDNCGKIKIPPDWNYVVDDTLVYFLDEEQNPIMIEYYYSEDMISNRYYSNIICEGFITSSCTSNGTIYGEYRIIYEGNEKVLLYLDVGYGEGLKTFLVWDTDLSKNQLIEIAQTFVASNET